MSAFGRPEHRTKYSYDAAGNETAYGSLSFTYNAAGRVSSVTGSSGTTSYLYNALGQRIKKSSSGATTYFVYDEGGHLIGEYDGLGGLIQEVIWLGDTPIASVRLEPCGFSIFYIHTDHLNAPRRITRRSTAQVVWSWESDPFGSTAANENPSGLGSFPFNLRLPGQYYDAETGTNYNYFRDYDPATGRYVESDPLGLRAGVNTYAYVNGNPSSLVDPAGLMGSGAGAGHPGTRPPPYSPPPAYIPPATKAKICALLKANGWNSNFAWQAADKIRLGPWGNGIGTWGDLENREVENWLSIIAWPNGPQSDPGNINFYEGTVKFYFRWIYHTTEYSPEAWGTALEALSHKHDTPDDLKKWCNDCGK